MKSNNSENNFMQVTNALLKSTVSSKQNFEQHETYHINLENFVTWKLIV